MTVTRTEIGEIFAQHRQNVFAICRHLTNSAADAEDATQEVFLALFRALPGFRGECALGTFIHRIAVRTALKQKRRPAAPISDAEPDPAPATDDVIDSRQRHAKLLDAVERLSLEHRIVIALFAVDGMSHKDIAETLGIPEGTVWSRLHSARKQLAAQLG
jgi:RNA polymerase sigma-70 factor (ECF subfamily)